MRKGTLLSAASVALLLMGGCAQPEPATEPSEEFRPTATIRDIMFAMIDPSADEIWESVATVVDFEGVHETFPETDEEWEAVRGAAIRVLEGSNLIMMPGRRVAEPGAVAEDSELELSPDEIQQLIDEDRNQWFERAHELHDMAAVSLAAIDARDTEALLTSGEGLDRACERCHLTYWYPRDEAARTIFEETERLRLEQSGEDAQ